MSTVILVCVLLAVCSGCAIFCSKKSGIQAGNSSDNPVTKVVIETDAGSYQIGAVQAHSVSGIRKLTSSVGKESTVKWTDTEGKEHSVRCVSNKIINKDFYGVVQFQIDAENKVRMFVLPHPGSAGSDLPWSTPASWEGAPTLPGFNNR